MHGDYQFANVMYANEVPGRLAAVIDWEMTTIGDPLLDLGWMLISWPPEGDDMTRYVSLDGMPSSVAKFALGGAVDPKVASFGTLVLELIRKAAELSRTAAEPGKLI